MFLERYKKIIVIANADEAKAERSVLSMPKRKPGGLSKVTRIKKL